MPEMTSKITETDYSMTSTERIGYSNPYLNTDTQKINSKLTEDLNVKGKTSKLLGKTYKRILL